MTVRRMRPLIWLDTLQDEAGTGLLDVANMQMPPSSGFDQSEIDDVRARCAQEPGRRLVISVHRTPNAAEGKRASRMHSDSWDGVTIQTARINTPDDGLKTVKPRWTAVTACIES